jgi:hypothetical protein
MFSSTASPSSWWNIGVWLASESRLDTRPGDAEDEGASRRRIGSVDRALPNCSALVT